MPAVHRAERNGPSKTKQGLYDLAATCLLSETEHRWQGSRRLSPSHRPPSGCAERHKHETQWHLDIREGRTDPRQISTTVWLGSFKNVRKGLACTSTSIPVGRYRCRHTKYYDAYAFKGHKIQLNKPLLYSCPVHRLHELSRARDRGAQQAVMRLQRVVQKRTSLAYTVLRT